MLPVINPRNFVAEVFNIILSFIVIVVFIATVMFVRSYKLTPRV